MARRKSALALIVVAALGATVTLAADDMGKDLGATIALQGLPCNKVVESKRNGDSDYTATCKDGNRYHVFLDANGRVIVKKV